MTTTSGLPPGLRAALPLALPTAVVGLSFGLLAAPLLGAVPAVVMSALVWSGTAQSRPSASSRVSSPSS